MSTVLFLILMAVLTLGPPLVGGSRLPLMLGDHPSLWEWFTHPWVHQGPYHLLLDGSAFIALWGMLDPKSFRRWGLLAAANLGSAAAIWITGTGAATGFGGLSGIAHGLLAAIAVDWIRGTDKNLRAPGMIILLLVLGKAWVETATGHPIFQSMHLGNIGTPLVHCHLGGVLGALAFCLLVPERSGPTMSIGSDKVRQSQAGLTIIRVGFDDRLASGDDFH